MGTLRFQLVPYPLYRAPRMSSTAPDARGSTGKRRQILQFLLVEGRGCYEVEIDFCCSFVRILAIIS